MKKTTKKKTGMPSLREAFVIKEKEACEDEKEVDEAGPPPTPGTVPGKTPPLPSGAMQTQKSAASKQPQAQQFASGLMSDVLSFEKEMQINRSAYTGLEVTSELQKVKTAAQDLKTKVDNWLAQSSGKVMPPSPFGGNA